MMIFSQRKYCLELLRRSEEQIPGYLSGMIVSGYLYKDQEIKNKVRLGDWDYVEELIREAIKKEIRLIMINGVLNYREDRPLRDIHK